MLHDPIASDAVRYPACGERRRHDRVPCPTEVVMAWHHDIGTPVRYRMIDASDGGYRISSSTPAITGMTGTILRLLPDGVPINHAVTVAWAIQKGEPGRYEIGLRRF